jgi:nitrogen fixation/metabolism regulation signal transduction histidine kinase
VGARWLAPMVDRLGRTMNVAVAIDAPAPAKEDSAQASCVLGDAAGASVPIVVTKPRKELYENLAHIDETVLYAGLASTGVALLLAVLIARSIGRPIAELAAEARKVAAGEARPIHVKGSGEIGELAQAFDKMLEDLGVMRRRLAATSRVAAWREVARRVAHEVKNPLAPIRAAVETLRRLRARNDPAFDEYFDEATRTVLDEVHRIANIVTEFTRFARLPPPRPQEIELVEIARQVVQLHKAHASGAKVDVVVHKVPPLVRADRDQVVQVLTNLVQNGIDAVAEKKDAGRVTVTLDTDGKGHASMTVSDNGPGIAPEIAGRLFEPYATTKAHGTGLGLAIAQRIAIEHNGELSYVAQTDGGAVFRFVLPVEGPAPASEMPPSSG